jgi:membrane protein required for colicin V production
MNGIDLSLLMVLLLFGLRGYFRGLFREVFSLLGLAAGFVGAARHAETMGGVIAPYWNAAPILLKGVGFVVCFFLVYVLFNLTGWLLHRSAKALFLQTVNRCGGVVLGLGKGAALAALAVYAVTSTTLVPSSAREKLEQSYLVAPLANLADSLIRFGKAKVFIQGSSHEARTTKHSRLGQS